MKYNCRFCDWVIDGQTQITLLILKHEKTHPENDINNLKFDKPDGSKPMCHICGCKEDHEV